MADGVASNASFPNDVLYFPNINIRSMGWLKSALLLWDHVYRIVPEGFTPVDSDDVRECIDQGKVRDLKLSQAELVEVAIRHRKFIDGLKHLPDGLDDAETRPLHRNKIDKRLYPKLLELAQAFDQHGFLHIGYFRERCYMFELAQVVARHRNLARATDDDDAWAVAPYFSEDGNFDTELRHIKNDQNYGNYGALVLNDLIPLGIANTKMRDVLSLAEKRRGQRAELRSKICTVGDELAKIQPKDRVEERLADILMDLARVKDDYRNSIRFGNRTDLYCTVGVGLALVAGYVYSVLTGSKISPQMISSGVAIGAIAAYATYRYMQGSPSQSMGAYLLDVEHLSKDVIGQAADVIDEFMND